MFCELQFFVLFELEIEYKISEFVRTLVLDSMETDGSFKIGIGVTVSISFEILRFFSVKQCEFKHTF